MKLPEKLEKLRNLKSGEEYGVFSSSCYKTGFDDCAAELLPIVEEMEKALNFIREKTVTDLADGPELRARIAQVYYAACAALRRN